MAGSGRHPFLIEVVVDHHRGTSRSYALLRTLVTHPAGDSEVSFLNGLTLAVVYIITPVVVHSCSSLSCSSVDTILVPSPRIDPPMNYQVTQASDFLL